MCQNQHFVQPCNPWEFFEVKFGFSSGKLIGLICTNHSVIKDRTLLLVRVNEVRECCVILGNILLISFL